MTEDSTYFTEPYGENEASQQEIENVSVSASGVAMLSRSIIDGEIVALKSLKPEFRGNPFYEEALRKEASAGLELDCPYIRKTLDFKEIAGLGHTIVMRWIDGESLSQRIQRPISGALLRKFTLQLCQALQCLHSRGLVHRDIKPDNILISRNGEDVRLIDLGFCDADFYAKCKIPAGSLKWAAPEQRAGSLPDVRSDIYSFGLVIKEMSKAGGSGWRKIVNRCTTPNPRDRYQSVEEIRQAVVSMERRKRLLPLSAGAMTLALLVAGAIFFSSDSWSNIRETQQKKQTINETFRMIEKAGRPLSK